MFKYYEIYLADCSCNSLADDLASKNRELISTTSALLTVLRPCDSASTFEGDNN